MVRVARSGRGERSAKSNSPHPLHRVDLRSCSLLYIRRVDLPERERQAGMADFVFHDPSGRRARRAGMSVGLLVSLAALIVAGFFATLAFAPRLPQLSLKDPRVLQALHVETVHRLKGKPGWTRVPHRPNYGLPGGPTRPLSVGFYVSWDPNSIDSLKHHIDQLDVVAPQWIVLNGSGGPVTVTQDPQAEAIIAAAKNAPSVLPIVHNAHNGLSDGPLADNLLVNPK